MFIYFVPTNAVLTPQTLPPAVAHAFDGPFKQSGCRGPGGKQGKILHAGEVLGYYPDQQTWRPIPGGDGCQVGWSTEANLEAADVPGQLARKEQVPGADVVDSLGRQWHVPFAMNWIEDESGRSAPSRACPAAMR